MITECDSFFDLGKVTVSIVEDKEGWPEEIYNKGRFSVYKKGDTIRFLMDGKEAMKRDHLWEFYELFWFLLKNHEGDEIVQVSLTKSRQ